MLRRSLLSVVALCGFALPALAQQGTKPDLFPFVLPWDDGSAGSTDVSGWLSKPAGKAGFITVKDGHLFEGNQRIRFFGVNMAFDANFPAHEDAEKIAARLAKFGVNCVRFHHMDTIEHPVGLLEKDHQTINKDYLDRLDYFIAQLKARGIYTNLNLHVGRHYPGEPDAHGNPYYKGIDQYVPRMIQLQKDFARELLTHVNPYTKLNYIDDASVAFVEINNENGLIHSWWNTHFDALLAAHGAELQKQWNAWLKAKYANNGKLTQAWPGVAAVEDRELLNPDLGTWWLEEHGGADATKTLGTVRKTDLPESDKLTGEMIQTLKIEVKKPGLENWHVQANQPKLELKRGQRYRAELWVRSSRQRSIVIAAAQAHEPWQLFSMKNVKISPKWQKVSLSFSAGESDEKNARIIVGGLGIIPGDCEFAAVSLRPERIDGLAPNEKLGSVNIFTREEFARRTMEAQRDWIKFIWDTEEKYWLEMQDYLKKDLRVKSPIIGTQMGYSPFPIQAKLDVVDVHGYWRHPEFPNNDWSSTNWFIKTDSMVRAKGAGELGHLAGTRVYGKPYVCTEYNHSAPNQFSSEAFLLAAAFAAQQDWDGIFAFAYSHSINANKAGQISGFFDLAQHPTKMATLPAAHAMFVRGDVKAWDNKVAGPTAVPTLEEVQDAVRTRSASPGVRQFGMDNSVRAIEGPISIALRGSGLPRGLAQWAESMHWDADKGVVTIHSPLSAGIIGYFDDAKMDLASVKIERATPVNWQPGKPPFDKRWCTITATVMEGKDFASAKKVLIVATGAAENVDMGWKNPEKTTVGRDWGKAPSLVEGIDATITLPVAGMKVWALDEKGQRKEEVPVMNDSSGSRFLIGPRYQTLWYEALAK